MKVDKMSNIVVLKGMSSNIVEEAIVVLKPNIKLKSRKISNTSNISEKNKSNTILKEAENVVSTYINTIQNESKKIDKEKTEKKYRKLKQICILLTITNIISIIKIIF